jgi:hypothetical protein
MSKEQTVPLDCPPAGHPASVDATRLPTALALEMPRNIARLWEAGEWMFSFPAMLATALVGRLFYEARNFVTDPDLWWHVRVGSDILKTHHWPTVDSYSFTAVGTPWIAYEWLGEVALASVAKVGGIFALGAFRFFLAAIVLLALYYYGTLRSGNCKAGFVPVGLLCSLVLLSFTLRPQMFGYLFLVILLIVLEWFRKGVAWPLWTLPFLFLAWVNTHGSFIVGIGVLAVYLVSGLRSFHLGGVEAIAWTRKQRLQLETTLLFSLAALPITPYGAQAAVYPFDMAFNQPINVGWILEWRPIPFDQSGGKLFLAIIVLMLALQILFRFVWRLEELLLVFGGTVIACLHVRMLLVFIPLIVPILATMVARWIPPYDKAKEHYALNGLLIAAIIAAMVHYVPSRDSVQSKVEAEYPVAALAYMNSHSVPGPVLNTYAFGGYLVGVGQKVFIDGRGDLYERSGVLSDYITLTLMKPGAFGVLDRYRIQSCLVLNDEPLSVVLGLSSDWKKVYVDGTSAIFVRKTALEAAKLN